MQPRQTMPGLSSPRSSPPGGRLPPLSREADDVLEASWRNISPTNMESMKTTTTGHKSKVRSQQNPRNMQVAVPEEKTVAIHTDIGKKPRFLYDLETFLERELQSLGVVSVEPNDTRLQAHREVFEYLVEDFKTYKPIFAAIKNEYEMVLLQQQSYIKQLEPLQQMLVTVTEQCDKQIMILRDNEKQDIIQLKKDNEKLQNIIDQIKNDQFALQIQIERLQQKLADQYDKYRTEAEARKLLVSDINDLRIQQEELILQQQQASNRDESEDPGLMRIALMKARANEKEATQMLNDIIANYGDVIPKKDYVALQKQYQLLQEQVQEKQTQFDALKEEHDTLLETYNSVIKQRDEYYQESERLRQTATPRPEWNRCADVIAGGVQRWNELSQGKSSDQLVDILLNELAGSGADNNVPDFFDALGTGDDVPAHLRKAEGKVKNRRIGKRDATLLIKDVWREKDAFDSSQTTSRIPMSEYLVQYLKAKFSDQNMVEEWTYNLENACQRYVHDEKIQLFYNVLNGTVDQELYFIQLQYIVTLLKTLTKENDGREPAGFFTQPEFTQILITFFNGQIPDTEIESLITAAQTELDDPDTPDIEFTRLFFEDDEGKFGPFVDELKKKFALVKDNYIESIMVSFKSAELEVVQPAELDKALTDADAELDAAKRELILLWVFRVKAKAELETVEALGLEAVQERLHNKHIKKFF